MSIVSLESAVGGIVAKHPAAETKAFKKKLPKAIRAALEKTFKYWHKTYAPHHFKRQAFSRYPNEYGKSSKKALSQIIKRQIKAGTNTDKPLVKTCRLRSAFLHGTVIYTGNNYDLKANFKSLPDYGYKYRPNQTNKQKAMVTVNESEFSSLVKMFEKFFQAEINKADPSSKTLGTAVL